MSSLALAATVAACALGQPGELLHAERFDGPLRQWVTEIEPKPGSTIGAHKGKLVMDVAGGATAWFKQPLSGNYVISFRRKVIVAGGPNDRVSDLNVFWAARDPGKAKLVKRSGKFEDYDTLPMYYVGIGGNTNTTTRLRRYDGRERVLLHEHLDQAHLLEGNREYLVAIAVLDGCTSVAVDGKLLFFYRDPQPLGKGYFGFRTTWSRHEIDDVEVRRLR